MPTHITTNIASRKAKSIIYNPHFWTIACVMIILALIYNASHIGLIQWFPWLEDLTTAKEVYAFVLSFLFLIPITHASAIFRLQGVLITWFLFLAAILPHALYEPNFESLLRISLLAVIALLLGLFVALDYNTGSELAIQAGKARRTLLSRILRAREYERRRLARELHDNTIQSLLEIANRTHSLEMGDHGKLTPEVKQQAEQIVVMLLHTIDNVRKVSHELRPSIVESVGLLPTLRWLAQRISEDNGVKVDVCILGKELRLRPEVELIIFKIAQEALNNVILHARATLVTVTLHFATLKFKMTVKDNGQGFCFEKIPSGFGNRGNMGIGWMEEQAQLLDGDLSIFSEDGEGTEVTLGIDL